MTLRIVARDCRRSSRSPRTASAPSRRDARPSPRAFGSTNYPRACAGDAERRDGHRHGEGLRALASRRRPSSSTRCRMRREPEGLPKDAVWRDKPRFDIPGGVWLPDTGFGAISEATQRLFRKGPRQGERRRQEEAAASSIASPIAGCRGTQRSARSRSATPMSVGIRKARTAGRRPDIRSRRRSPSRATERHSIAAMIAARQRAEALLDQRRALADIATILRCSSKSRTRHCSASAAFLHRLRVGRLAVPAVRAAPASPRASCPPFPSAAGRNGRARSRPRGARRSCVR